MHIVKVKGHNFKRLNNDIECHKKMLLLGANGSGKSQVLEAIALSVLGYDRDEFGLPIKQVLQIINNRAKISTSDMLVGATWDTGFSVERQFQITKKDVGRQIARCYPSLNEKTVKAVDARVEAELGVLPEMYSVYPLLSKTPADLRRYFLALCDTQAWSWDNLYAKIKESIGNVEIDQSLLDKMQSVFKPDKPIDENLYGLVNLLAAEYSETNKMAKQHEATTVTISDMKQKYDQQRIDELGAEISGTESTLQKLRDKIIEIGKLNTVVETLRSKVQDRTTVDIDTLTQTIQSLEKSIVSIEFPAEYPELKSELEQAQKALTEIEVVIQVSKRDISELKKTLEVKACPILGVVCDKIVEVVAKNKDDIIVLKKLIESNQGRISDLEAKIDEIRLGISGIEGGMAGQRLQNEFYEKQIENLRGQIELANSRNKDAQELKNAEQQVAEVEDLESLNQAIQEAEATTIRLQKELRGHETVKATLDGFRLAAQDGERAEAYLELIKLLGNTIGYRQGIAGNVLREAIAPFEVVMNSLLSKIDPDFTGYINFESAAGREVFDLMFNNVSSKSISTGQRSLFLSALQISLIVGRDDLKYKCVFVDNMEIVDNMEGLKRDRFVQTMCKFVDDGLIDQFIGASSSGIEWKPADDECTVVIMG